MQDLLEFGYGSVQWIAAQDKSRESREYWGTAIVLDSVFERDKYVDFFISQDDFDVHTDEQLAVRFAEHIIGYPVGSPQDVERKRRYMQTWIDRYSKEIEHATKQRDYWIQRLEKLSNQQGKSA
jgi:hypothetical protein